MTKIVRNLPMSDYLADDGLSSSRLKLLVTATPLDFLTYQVLPTEKKGITQPSGQLFGELIHTALLETAHLSERYVFEQQDNGPANKNPGRTAWRAICDEAFACGKIPVRYTVKQEMLCALQAIRRNKSFERILNHPKLEPELTAFCEIDGVRLKARVDSAIAPHAYEIKTTADPVDDAGIKRTILRYLYHFQRAHHLTVFGQAQPGLFENHSWVFVSTKPPYHARVIDSTVLGEMGLDLWREAFDIYKKALASGDWYGYPDRTSIDYLFTS